MKVFCTIPRWTAIVLMLGNMVTVGAQQTPPAPRLPPMPGASSPAGSPVDENDAEARRMAMQQSARRNDLRQQQIVSDTAKLLTLAQQLKDAVDKSNKDMLSIAVVKKAEEIEKLAKSVKEKMREGQ